MTMTIDFTPQEQTWIDTQAAEQSVSAVDVIHRLIGDLLPLRHTPAAYRTPRERIAAMDTLASATRGAASLPDTAFDRDNIYEDRL